MSDEIDNKNSGNKKKIIVEPTKWTEEPPPEPKYPVSPKVTERDKFRLAKYILLIAVFIFFVVAVFYGSVDKNAAEKIWNFTSVAVNSIVTLVIGYYFGTQAKG